MTLTAELPLVVRLDQFVVRAARGRARSAAGWMRELALARLAALAALDDQTLSGLMTVRATVGGTVGAPELAGQPRRRAAALRQRHDRHGAERPDRPARRADARQVVIERFAATDGGSGTLSAEGTVGIDPAAGFPLDLQRRPERMPGWCGATTSTRPSAAAAAGRRHRRDEACRQAHGQSRRHPDPGQVGPERRRDQGRGDRDRRASRSRRPARRRTRWRWRSISRSTCRAGCSSAAAAWNPSGAASCR